MSLFTNNSCDVTQKSGQTRTEFRREDYDTQRDTLTCSIDQSKSILLDGMHDNTNFNYKFKS